MIEKKVVKDGGTCLVCGRGGNKSKVVLEECVALYPTKLLTKHLYLANLHALVE